MQCNWINSAEGQPLCSVPSCPLPVPATALNTETQKPQWFSSRLAGSGCPLSHGTRLELRNPGQWQSGRLLCFAAAATGTD